MSCPQRHSDAAYVLGALCPAERGAYEAHVDQCPECTASVARLAPMPGLLGRVDPAMLDLAAPGAGAGDRGDALVAVVTAQRRRGRWRQRTRLAVAAGAAALVAAAATAGATALLDEPGPAAPAAPVAMAPVGGPTLVTAEVATVVTAAGTQVWLACRYPSDGLTESAYVFRLVAVGADGSVEQLGSWSAGPGDEVTLTGLTRFTDGELTRIELRGDTGDPLLAYQLPE